MIPSHSDKEPKRNSTVVDMSGDAISRRIREVSELHQLGMSLSNAKRMNSNTDARNSDDHHVSKDYENQERRFST